MAIRIVRNQDGNCITFRGSTNPVYWNACLSAEVDAENPDRVNVINDIRSSDGPVVYEFFKIPFTEFLDADGNPFASAQDAADYITANASVADVTAASYRGVWDANTNTPTLTDGNSANRGDFYYVSTNGSTALGGISTWRRGDRIIWNGTAWQKLEATSVVDANTRSTLLDTQVSIFADGEHAAKDPQGAPGWYYQNTENNKINWYFYGDTDVTSYSYGDFGGAYMVVDIRTQGSQLFWSVYTKPQLDGEDQEFWYRSRVTYDNAAGMQASVPGRYLVHTSNLDVTGIETLLPRISLPVEASTTVGPLGDAEEVYLMALSTSPGLAASSNEFVVEKVGMMLGEYIQAYDLVAVPTTSAQAGATTPTTIDFERDVTGTTISDDAGQQFGVNTIRAVGNGDNTIDIINDKTGEVIYDNLDMTQIEIDGTSAGNTEYAVANALNSLFFNTPLGDGGSYVPTFPTLDAADITYNLAEGIIPTTEVTPGTAHLYGRGTDSSGHGARLWSNETIDTAGEYFLVKIIGNGRFIIGFADGTTDSNGNGTADDLEELANNSGSAASGLFWSQAIYDYGSYTAPWTWYGSSASGSYGPGWSGAQSGMMRYNNDVQAALIAGSGSGVLFKAGIDSQGYLAVWYWDEGRSNDWVMTSRRSTATPGDRNYHLVVKLWDQNSTIVEIPQRVATDPAAPVLNYRFIESPDGEFYYPLFATAEEAEYVDTANGGSGSSHTHVFVDEPTNSTWYMPSTGGVHAGASAPADTAEITYTRIDTEADSLHTPSAFTMQDLTVTEGGQVNYQVAPQGLTNWTTTVTGLPSGLSFDGATLIQGQAPFVSGDTASNPSDVFAITVTRTNSFGSTSATFDLTVQNTTQPSVAVTGFEPLAVGSQSGTLMGNVDGQEDAAVQISQLLEPGKRMIFSKSWTEANILPYVQDDANDVYVGVPEPSVNWSDVGTGDFDAMFKLEGTANTSHVSKIKVDPLSGDSFNINSLTNAFYDYALEWDGEDLHVIACNFNDINTQPGLSNGGSFSRTMTYTGYGAARGLSEQSLDMFIGVDNGGQANLDAVGITVIDIPLGDRDFQVVEQSHNSATFNGLPVEEITLEAGYTYRFMLNDDSIHSGDTLTFETLDGTAYTTGVTTVGSFGDYLYYVEFQVPSDVPSLNIVFNGTTQGVIGGGGGSATMTTPWNKALDFGGSSERAQVVNTSMYYNPLMMNNIGMTIPAGTAGSTASSSNARPWATVCVFKIDGNYSNQHIWNLGEGAGTGDDNIYLRVSADKRLYFGWGREGSGYNECTIFPIPSQPNGFLGTPAWYSVYIAHTGERLSGNNASAANLADCFDIRLMNSMGNNWTLGSNLSVPAAWTSTGARMDRQFTGAMTIGGRGANRSFHGQIAAMVGTTLRINQAMPTDAEINMMMRDPQQWMTNYKEGSTFRPAYQGNAVLNFTKNNFAEAGATQVWLMGDGTSDAYAKIRNQVYPADQNQSPLNMISMVSNDIQTVNIPGLT